jgi:hypothetical protein
MGGLWEGREATYRNDETQIDTAAGRGQAATSQITQSLSSRPSSPAYYPPKNLVLVYTSHIALKWLPVQVQHRAQKPANGGRKPPPRLKQKILGKATIYIWQDGLEEQLASILVLIDGKRFADKIIQQALCDRGRQLAAAPISKHRDRRCGRPLGGGEATSLPIEMIT